MTGVPLLLYIPINTLFILWILNDSAKTRSGLIIIFQLSITVNIFQVFVFFLRLLVEGNIIENVVEMGVALVSSLLSVYYLKIAKRFAK